ncbi:hypothetical protein GDO81_000799 [Engystomops pustulosus]|uniref:Uncharacterized protein n=1 Tax=Engystomops pustulosus TaxID=76066 RepID=A0AAV7DAV2_ENGPU|nr:hypothetical protein GDO81_000799 [Engystomops pustulosus]
MSSRMFPSLEDMCACVPATIATPVVKATHDIIYKQQQRPMTAALQNGMHLVRQLAIDHHIMSPIQS